MNSYDFFRIKTQPIVNGLYILTILLLPWFWLMDCKSIVSLLFKQIESAFSGEDGNTVEVQANLQIILMLIGIGAFCIHNRLRLSQHARRYDILMQENSFVDTHELYNLKIKLVKQINKIAESSDQNQNEDRACKGDSIDWEDPDSDIQNLSETDFTSGSYDQHGDISDRLLISL